MIILYISSAVTILTIILAIITIIKGRRLFKKAFIIYLMSIIFTSFGILFFGACYNGFFREKIK
jgi:hypothetical protein